MAQKEEEGLNTRFQKHFKNKGFNGKFEKFNKITEDLSKSKTFLKRFWFKRTLLIIFNVFSKFEKLLRPGRSPAAYSVKIFFLGIGLLTAFYYHPAFNIERFNCPLPEELYYINDKNLTVTYAVHYYNAYRFRYVQIPGPNSGPIPG